jgi:hypothetical protein
VGNIARAAWSAPTTHEEVARRCAGRRHYNAHRQILAAYRRTRVAKLLMAQGSMFEHGVQAAIARQLGVSRSTVCRDVAALLKEGHPCPTCGAYRQPADPGVPGVETLLELPDEEDPEEGLPCYHEANHQADPRRSEQAADPGSREGQMT